MRFEYASTKSAAALLPREKDFIASSSRILSACILIPLARVVLEDVDELARAGRSTSITAHLGGDVRHHEHAVGDEHGLVCRWRPKKVRPSWRRGRVKLVEDHDLWGC